MKNDIPLTLLFGESVHCCHQYKWNNSGKNEIGHSSTLMRNLDKSLTDMSYSQDMKWTYRPP